MKKLITLMLIFCIYVSVSAQDEIKKTIISPEIEPIFTPKSSENKARIEVDFNNDTVWVFSYSYQIINNDTTGKTRHLDCKFPYDPKDFEAIFIKYDAWIKTNKL